MQATGSIEIERPIDEVFDAACNAMPHWSDIVVEDELIEDVPGVVGSRFRTVTQEQGKQMIFEGKVTAYEHPRLQAVHMAGQYFDIDTEFRFEEISGRTRVTQFADVRGKGFFKVILWTTGWFMKKSQCEAAQNELENLKRFCETSVAATA
ncbi:MAG: SRPBCC family protein [Planctomycetota bacterium]